jgi:hypothetical protein
VIIDFPRRKLTLKGDEEGNTTEAAFVDVGQADNATGDNPEVEGSNVVTSRPICQQKQSLTQTTQPYIMYRPMKDFSMQVLKLCRKS